MSAVTQALSDSWLIVKTDRRVWAATSFVVIALVVWSITGGWRNYASDKKPEVAKIASDDIFIKSLVTDVHATLAGEKKRREEFKTVLQRTVSELDADKQKIEWHANTLVDKLTNMTIRVDKIAKDIGSRRIERAALEAKLHKGASKRVKRQEQEEEKLMDKNEEEEPGPPLPPGRR